MLTSSTTILWLAGLGFQFVLVFVLLAKKFWSKFPVFLAYSVFCFASATALYGVRNLRTVYFFTFWVCEGVSLLLGFGVIYEVLRRLLHPYKALHRMAAVTFQSTVVLLIASSCLVAYLQPLGERNGLVAAILVAEEATRIVEVGLLMFLFIFSTAFGLHWRQQVFGITIGLGLFVTIELINATVRAHLGVAATSVFSTIRMLSFDLSLLVWIGYVLAPERLTSTSEIPQRAQLEQWNQAIMELINQ